MLCVSLVQNNLLLSIYNMNDEQTGQSWDQHLGQHLWHTYCRRRMLKNRAGLFSAHHVSGLCLCHINIQLYPICPVNSLSIVAKGGGQCQHYLCQYRHFITSVSLCSGCWLLLHRVCPWDDCSVQGHSVCVCVCGENICWLSLPWQGKGFVEYWSAMPFPDVPAVSPPVDVCRISMLMRPCAECVLCCY